MQKNYSSSFTRNFHFSLLLELLLEVSTQTGVVLDTTFTVKALRGLLSEMKKNPGRFKGRRILFIHTGTNISVVTVGLLWLYNSKRSLIGGGFMVLQLVLVHDYSSLPVNYHYNISCKYQIAVLPDLQCTVFYILSAHDVLSAHPLL